MLKNSKAKNSKGSASVFLVFILSSMIMMVVAFIYSAGQSAVRSSADSLLNVAGRAVLSEFDLDLKKDYGIFAFIGQSSDIKKRSINMQAILSMTTNMLLSKCLKLKPKIIR